MNDIFMNLLRNCKCIILNRTTHNFITYDNSNDIRTFDNKESAENYINRNELEFLDMSIIPVL